MKLLILLGCLFLLALACNRSSNDREVEEWPYSNLSPNWSLKLPKHSTIDYRKDSLFPYQVCFEKDSMQLKFSLQKSSKEDAVDNYEFTVDAVKNNTPVGFCLGDYDGDYEFYPFLDTHNKLSGIMADFDDHGIKSVWARIEDLNTGETIDLSFESLTNKKIKLVHAIIKSIKFNR